jgi:hypothetical protein
MTLNWGQFRFQLGGERSHQGQTFLNFLKVNYVSPRLKDKIPKIPDGAEILPRNFQELKVSQNQNKGNRVFIP